MYSEGLTTTVLPMRSAGAICQMVIIIGQFHGPIAPDDADGAVVQLGVAFAVVDDDLAARARGGGGAQPRGAGADLEAGVGPVQRLALLARQQLGRAPRRSRRSRRPRAAGAHPRPRRSAGPGGLRVAGPGDRGVEVGDGADRCAADDLAGRGIEDLAAAGVGDASEQSFVGTSSWLLP